MTFCASASSALRLAPTRTASSAHSALRSRSSARLLYICHRVVERPSAPWPAVARPVPCRLSPSPLGILLAAGFCRSPPGGVIPGPIGIRCRGTEVCRRCHGRIVAGIQDISTGACRARATRRNVDDHGNRGSEDRLDDDAHGSIEPPRSIHSEGSRHRLPSAVARSIPRSMKSLVAGPITPIDVEHQ